MASLKDLRNRIASVKATQKITRAMQMVAAAKLRRAEAAAEAARPYADRMDDVLAGLASSTKGMPGASPLLAGTGKDDVQLVLVLTADRGLCGAFNSSIVRLARQHIDRLTGEGKTVKILCVGRKGADQLRRQHKDKIIDVISFRDRKTLTFAEAREVGDRVLKMFAEGEFDVATMFYSRFKSVITQVPTAQRLVPAEIKESEDEEQEDTGPSALYEYEPDEEEILDDLLPRNVSVQIFRALLENGASEQGARMSAMDSATRNAGELIDKLSLEYNRTRQAQITTELTEIVSGAEAL